jgi:two-component system cell cycle sensor histidine kinase/response regulator CckA
MRGFPLGTGLALRWDVHVLLVEDDPRVRTLGALVLRYAGHTVVTADGPLEALDIVKADRDIGVVVTDIVMPDMNGFDLADELRQMEPSIRVVFMSGFTGDCFQKSGRDPFVAKPFTPASLAEGVERALS